MRLKLCPLTELGDGEVREFEVGETEGIVIRSGEDIFAIQRYCSHELFPLEFGLLQDDNTLRCTFHGAVFDLASGKSVGDLVTLDLTTYPVAIEDGDVIIELPEEG